MLSPENIVDQMMTSDRMSQWLGIEISAYDQGNVVCKMVVRKEMVNGFNIAHGGITYSLADSALAFSANSFGIHAVSIETSISHLKPVKIGDILTTETEVVSLSPKIGVLTTSIFNQNNILVASFKGTVYRKGIEWQ